MDYLGRTRASIEALHRNDKRQDSARTARLTILARPEIAHLAQIYLPLRVQLARLFPELSFERASHRRAPNCLAVRNKNALAGCRLHPALGRSQPLRSRSDIAWPCSNR